MREDVVGKAPTLLFTDAVIPDQDNLGDADD